MIGGTGLSWTAVGAIAQAIEALVVLASAIVIVFEVQRMRRESIEDRVTGLKMAYEILDSEDFEKVTRAAMEGQSVHGMNWRSLLDRVNLVASLIDQNYTDLELFLQLKGLQLANIGKCIRRDAPPQLVSEPTYIPAQRLLQKAQEYANEQ